MPAVTVDPGIRAFVIFRDGVCIAALLDRSHQCRDAWGEPHDPRDLSKLTLEHVKDEPMMGRRAPSDEAHMVAMCHGGNAVELWGSANRDLCRAYLVGVCRSDR